MLNHIKTLKELKRITCQDCHAKKAGYACCVSDIDNFRLCSYIKSLNFAIELMEKLQSMYLNK